MDFKAQVEEIVHTLAVLPPEKVAELQDFARFLKDRYGKDQAANYTMDWSEDDLRALSQYVWTYAEQSLPWEEKSPEPR